MKDKMGVIDRLNKVANSLFHSHKERRMSSAKNDGVLTFHASCGKSVRRSTDGTTVYKKRCIWKKPSNALSFSNRTIVVDEIVTIDVTNVAVIIGFMFQSPESLPKMDSCFDVFHKGNGFGIVLPVGQSRSIEFYYNRYGDVHFKVDKEEVAMFFGVIDPKAAPWVLIDMYSSEKKIRAKDPDVMPIDFGPKSTIKVHSCDLCYASDADATLGKCGHASCCFACAKKWLSQRKGDRSCPYCRQTVTSVVKNNSSVRERRA